MNSFQLSRIVDLLVLDGDISSFRLVQLANIAKEYHTRSIITYPHATKTLSNILKGSDIKINTIIAYPYGQISTQEKIFSAKMAFDNGSDEISFVLSYHDLKDRKFQTIEEELARLIGLAKRYDKCTNIIVDPELLTYDELAKLARIIKKYEINTLILMSNRKVKDEELLVLRTVLNNNIKIEVIVEDFDDILNYAKKAVNRFMSYNAFELVDSFKEKYGK